MPRATGGAPAAPSTWGIDERPIALNADAALFYGKLTALHRALCFRKGSDQLGMIGFSGHMLAALCLGGILPRPSDFV